MSNTVQIKGRIDKMIDSKDSKTKAFASVTIGNTYAVHGIRIVESNIRSLRPRAMIVWADPTESLLICRR